MADNISMGSTLSSTSETTPMSSVGSSSLAANISGMIPSLSPAQNDQTTRDSSSADSVPEPASTPSTSEHPVWSDHARRAAYVGLMDIEACKHNSSRPDYKYHDTKVGNRSGRHQALEKLTDICGLLIYSKKSKHTRKPTGSECYNFICQAISHEVSKLTGKPCPRTERLWREGWDFFDFLSEEQRSKLESELQAAAKRVEARKKKPPPPYDKSLSKSCIRLGEDNKAEWFNPVNTAEPDSIGAQGKTIEPFLNASVAASMDRMSDNSDTMPSGTQGEVSQDCVPLAHSVMQGLSEDHALAGTEVVNEQDLMNRSVGEPPQYDRSQASADNKHKQKRRRLDIVNGGPGMKPVSAPQSDISAGDVLNVAVEPLTTGMNRARVSESVQEMVDRAASTSQLSVIKQVLDFSISALVPSNAFSQHRMPPTEGSLPPIDMNELQEKWRDLYKETQEVVDDFYAYIGFMYEDESGDIRHRSITMPLLPRETLSMWLAELYERCWGWPPEPARNLAQRLGAFSAKDCLTALTSAFLYEHILRLPTPIELSIAKQVARDDVNLPGNIAKVNLVESIRNAYGKQRCSSSPQAYTYPTSADDVVASKLRVKRMLSEAWKSSEWDTVKLDSYIEELLSTFWATFEPQLELCRQGARTFFPDSCEPARTRGKVHGMLDKLFRKTHQLKVELAASASDYLFVWPAHSMLYDASIMDSNRPISQALVSSNNYVAMTTFPGLEIRHLLYKELCSKTVLKAKVTIIHKKPANAPKI